MWDIFSELNQSNNRNGDLLTEISRLQAENAKLRVELEQVESENEHHIRLAFVDAGANPARSWKEEAERLAALARSDAEPDSKLEELVSRWEALKDGGGPSAPQDVLEEELLMIISLARKGLTAPPRPDTSSTGLLEAAKEIERQACRESHFHRAEAFNEAARIIRARAADRSGK